MTRKFVAIAHREPGQPLQLRLLDQAAAVRLVVGIRCRARSILAQRRRRCAGAGGRTRARMRTAIRAPARGVDAAWSSR